ncbi:MAG: DUF2786 domain-containing protein [Deltaproteobacteria bacterium]|nr:DUF2786 domain-containing protein [Deltaproteobacteria bacterium]
MKAIEPQLLDRLTKLVGMTGSSFDNEALTAIRMANDLLKEHRLTWEEIMRPREVVKYVVSAESTAPQPTSWLAKIEQIKRHWADLSPWEKNFTESVAQQVSGGWKLTQKQADILERLYAKFGG